MRKVQRSEIIDYQTYEDRRAQVRAEVLQIKAPRRIQVGEWLTFLFENADTIRYQIQEMVRVERMVRESDIAHELATYNDLLGDSGELGCTLLIGIDDRDEREEKLRAWRDLTGHLYMRLEDGRRVRPTFDPAQIGDEKLSSVQYLKFNVGRGVPSALGSDLTVLTIENGLTVEQRQALLSDLAGEGD